MKRAEKEKEKEKEAGGFLGFAVMALETKMGEGLLIPMEIGRQARTVVHGMLGQAGLDRFSSRPGSSLLENRKRPGWLVPDSQQNQR